MNTPVATRAPVAPPKAAPKAASYTAPDAPAPAPVIPPEVAARLAALEAENATLKAEHAPKALTFKVSEKGGLSVYGLGRFPVTLYKEQWVRVLDHERSIRAFLVSHDSQLKAKGEH